MDMVERVAMAISDNIQAGLPDGVTVDYEYAARAAIEAMREPTEAMRLAVENDTGIQCGLDDCNQHSIPDKSWRVMIDAALRKA